MSDNNEKLRKEPPATAKKTPEEVQSFLTDEARIQGAITVWYLNNGKIKIRQALRYAGFPKDETNDNKNRRKFQRRKEAFDKSKLLTTPSSTASLPVPSSVSIAEHPTSVSALTVNSQETVEDQDVPNLASRSGVERPKKKKTPKISGTTTSC